MAAGLGFKTFTTGEVLTAGDTNGYLMQGVLVFADAAARSAAITSPQEGQVSYLKSDDGIYTYSGSAWVAAGLPSQTGNASKYLTTNGTTASWGAVSADKTIVEIASGTLTSGTSLSLTSLSAYDTLKLRVNNSTTSADTDFSMTINSSSGSVYDYLIVTPTSNAGVSASAWDNSYITAQSYSTSDSNIPLTRVLQKQSSSTANFFEIDFFNCKATGFTTFQSIATYLTQFGGSWRQNNHSRGIFKTAATVSSIQFNTSSAFTAGNYVLWGG